MRYGIAIAIVGLSILPALAQESAAEIVDRAIRATGTTADRLEQLQVSTQKMRGVMVAPVGELPTRKGLLYQGDNQFRAAFEISVNDRMTGTSLGISGEKGWRIYPTGISDALGESEINDIRDELYCRWLSTLAPLKSNDVTLETLPSIKVNQQPAVGVKVTRKGKPTVSLYFDKKTMLLVKSVFTGRESGVKVTKETIFSDFQAFQNMQLPTKIVEVHNGLKAASWTVQDYSFPGKIDVKQFDRP